MGKQMAETLSLLTRQGNKMSKLDTSWFKPENYSSLPELSLEDWYSQFRLRFNISQGISTMHEDVPEWGWFDMSENIALIKKRGVLSMSMEEDLPNKSDFFSFIGVKLYPHTDQRAVQSMPTYDIKLMYEDGRFHDFLASYKACREGRGTDEQVRIYKGSIDDLRRDPSMAFYNESIAHVSVDMDATNTQIESDFKKWLSSYRLKWLSSHRFAFDSDKPKKEVNQATINSWVKYGVLQYIDLKLVERIEKKIITAKRLGDLIFPDEPDVDTTKRIPETTKVHAEKVLSFSFLKAFEMQVGALDDGIEY